MNKLLTTILFTLMTISLSAQEMIKGIWKTGEENTKIETYQKEGLWFGKIISSDNAKAKIGNDILRDFQKVDDEWKGKLFAAKRGKLLDAVMHASEDELQITVSAGLFIKKLTWLKEVKE